MRCVKKIHLQGVKKRLGLEGGGQDVGGNVEEILKNDWREKRPYSSVSFIGNPDWVSSRSDELRAYQRERRSQWRERHRKQFAVAHSP